MKHIIIPEKANVKLLSKAIYSLLAGLDYSVGKVTVDETNYQYYIRSQVDGDGTTIYSMFAFKTTGTFEMNIPLYISDMIIMPNFSMRLINISKGMTKLHDANDDINVLYGRFSDYRELFIEISNHIIEMYLHEKCKLTVYCLAKKFPNGDRHQVLNGAIFGLYWNKSKQQMEFIDLMKEDNTLWVIPNIESDTVQKNGTRIIQSSQTVYVCIPIEKAVKIFQDNQEEAEKLASTADSIAAELSDKKTLVYELVDEHSKPIHYGDGYSVKVFMFEKPITKKKFKEVLKDKKLAVNEKEEYPYGNYVNIYAGKFDDFKNRTKVEDWDYETISNVWTWQEIHQYTD